MCTSVGICLGSEQQSILLFGRNLDMDIPFDGSVTITPREYPLTFRCMGTLCEHYAMIGMAIVADEFPLYADAMNEKGLCMAGLHFPHNAVYRAPCDVADNATGLAPFELMPYLLGTCATVADVRNALKQQTILDIHFSQMIPNTPLHWHVVGRDGGMIIEATAEGLQLYDDLCGVLTNNPPYPYQVAHLHRYDGLSAHTPALSRSDSTVLGNTFDLGLGLVGLPGDYTSPARFARAATLCRLIRWEQLSDSAAVTHVFRILQTVAPPWGCVTTSEGVPHATLYTCCWDYYHRTYYVWKGNCVMPHAFVLAEEKCRGRELGIM